LHLNPGNQTTTKPHVSAAEGVRYAKAELFRLKEGNVKHYLIRGVCAWFLLVLLVACASRAPSIPTPNAATQLAIDLAAIPTHGRIIWRNEITSAALADNLIGDAATRNYIVYLPPGYDSTDKRYPVLYVLHWYTGSPSTFADQMPSSLDALVASAKVKPMILVFPDGSNRFYGSEYMSSPTIGDYETYLVRHLVAQVDSTYRTLPSRDSRGITGCSMGGLGSLHLALKYPDVYGVSAPMSGLFFQLEQDPGWQRSWEQARSKWHGEPRELADFDSLDGDTQGLINLAAIAASNPEKPPFFLDMPFNIVNGQAEIDQEVFQKINRLGLEYDVPAYISQPVRLNALLIYRDTNLGAEPLDREWATQAYLRFDKLLADSGVEHESAEVDAVHCTYDFSPILEFMGENLAY